MNAGPCMVFIWYTYTNMYTHQNAHAHPCSYMHAYPQTMDQLKLLLREEEINFNDTTFNTEDGIRGLGEQPFVSKMSTCK